VRLPLTPANWPLTLRGANGALLGSPGASPRRLVPPSRDEQMLPGPSVSRASLRVQVGSARAGAKQRRIPTLPSVSSAISVLRIATTTTTPHYAARPEDLALKQSLVPAAAGPAARCSAVRPEQAPLARAALVESLAGVSVPARAALVRISADQCLSVDQPRAERCRFALPFGAQSFQHRGRRGHRGRVPNMKLSEVNH
jgi:hypothetical protein